MTEATIHAKMVGILRDVDAIAKNAQNVSQGFKYRGIDDVYNAVNPVLAKHGVYMTAHILGKTREERTNAKGTVLAFTTLRMRYRFYAEDGSFTDTEAEGEGMDSGDKSSNKAMAIAHKYAILQAFCIPTKDLVDPDAEVHEVAPQVRPEGTERPPEANRKTAATEWANGAVSTFAKMSGADFEAWVEKNTKAIAAVRDLNEAAHKRLVDAIRNKYAAIAQAPLAAE